MKRILAAALAALMLLCGAALSETTLANPWTETTAEGLMDALGMTLGVPEGATNVAWRMSEALQMGELTFTWYETDYTARIAPTDAFEDISGVYCDWTQQMEDSVGRCQALDRRGQDGGNTVDLCLWYDELTGLMYSITVTEPDLDGFDILAAAEAVYVPMQSE